MVSQSFEHAGSHSTAQKNKFLKAISQPIRVTPFISIEQNFYTSGLKGLWKELSHRRISE